MRIVGSFIVTFGAVAVALTLSANSPPAEAGKVCKKLGLSDNCVKGSDLRGRLYLEQPDKNGRLRVRDQGGDIGVELDAKSGNVTNLFSNESDESNGPIKAWAKINANGTVAACWRCNRDSAETSQLGTGSYEIDFTPLTTDLTGRPRTATVSGTGILPVAGIRAVDRTTPPDESTVHVFTENPATGARVNAPFVLIIY